jgi:predicted small integral membrane protein
MIAKLVMNDVKKSFMTDKGPLPVVNGFSLTVAAKQFVAIGVGLGFLLWFGGFMVVGGEWFAMWQSKTWNGQEAAFRFYMTLLAVLIFVNQRDD